VKAENFLISWDTVRFWSRPVLHGVWLQIADYAEIVMLSVKMQWISAVWTFRWCLYFSVLSPFFCFEWPVYRCMLSVSNSEIGYSNLRAFQITYRSKKSSINRSVGHGSTNYMHCRLQETSTAMVIKAWSRHFLSVRNMNGCFQK
jgi:hypothetical protein